MSTQQVKLFDSIAEIAIGAPNLWTVQNCFEWNTIDRLRNISIDHEQRFSPGYQSNRMELTEDSKARVWLDSIGEQLCDPMSKITNISLSLMGVKYWIDLPWFCCPPHYDHKDILVTYQVYINSVPDPYLPIGGTHFMHVDPTIELPFVSNTGYINLNSDLKMHRVDGGNGSRTSIAFQFARQ